MQIDVALVHQIVAICWWVGLIAIPIAFFAWVFASGLFPPPAERIHPNNPAFWVILGSSGVATASCTIGAASCFLATWFTGTAVCNYGPYMLRPGSTSETRATIALFASAFQFFGALFILLVVVLVLLSGIGRYKAFAARVLQYQVRNDRGA